MVELNNQLQNEIAENRRKQEEVERLSADLQSLVTQRTEELAEARLNKTLLEKTNESLSNSNTALEEFSRASTEGFVEPLRVIDVYSKRLQERAGQELGEESRQWLSKVCEASSQASRLNAGLQRYSQLPLNEPVEELSLDSLVSRIIDDEAMADVVSIQPPGLGTAVLPGGTLTLVIRELLRNAKRFRISAAYPTPRRVASRCLYGITAAGFPLPSRSVSLRSSSNFIRRARVLAWRLFAASLVNMVAVSVLSVTVRVAASSALNSRCYNPLTFCPLTRRFCRECG